MAYNRDRHFKSRVKKFFQRQGWLIWGALPNSPVDLVCFRDGEVRLVQCKIDGYLSPNEREQLLELAAQNGFCAYLVKRERKKLIFVELTNSKSLQSVLWTE